MNNYIYNLFINYLLYFGLLSFWILDKKAKFLSFSLISCFALSGYLYAIFITKFNLFNIFAFILATSGSILNSIIILFFSKFSKKIDITLLSFVWTLLIYSLIVNSEITNTSKGILLFNPLSNNFFIILATFVISCIIINYSYINSYYGLATQVVYQKNKLNNLGIQNLHLELIIIIISSTLIGINGILSVSYLQYISPSVAHYSNISTMMLFSTLMNNRILNVFWVAFVLVIIPEVLRFISVNNSNISLLRNITLDLLLIILIYRKKYETST